VDGNGVSYTIGISRLAGFSFLFGFRGIGWHYRCDIQPRAGIIALYQVRDGLPLYLHHVCINLNEGSVISVIWHSRSIRVQLGGFTLFNVIVDGPPAGHWGFAAMDEPFSLPEFSHALEQPENYGWICLGDGFSNARWRNRHFLSWPEIVWGDGNTCLNACVAAGNSVRVLGAMRDLGSLPMGADVIVATGSDDLIEEENFADYTTRLGLIVAGLRQAGAAGIHLCTLPPRISALNCTRKWSDGIIEYACGENIPVLDFHSWILPEIAACMVRGEYPGAAAQQLIAVKTAERLGLEPAVGCPATFEPPRPCNGKLPALAFKAARHIEAWTLDFPGLIR
jgi:hypothetical protein